MLTYRPLYKLFSLVLYSLTLLSKILDLFIFLALIGVYFAILSRSYPLLTFMIIANGFCCISVFSCAYELGVELTYPIGEATSGGFINTVGNLIGFLILMGLTPILDK